MEPFQPVSRLRQTRLRDAEVDGRGFDIGVAEPRADFVERDVIAAAKAADSVGELARSWASGCQFMNERGIVALAAPLEAVRIERTRQRHISVSETDRPARRGALQAASGAPVRAGPGEGHFRTYFVMPRTVASAV